LEMLGSCLSICDLRSALNRLPKGVDAMYAATMERIEQQADPLLVKRTLVWLVYTLESMTINDLRHALAIDLDTSKYDPELLVDAESLLSACCGLITLEPQFVNYTAKDFLETYLQKDYPEPHALIASSCVAHLIYRGFQDMKDFVENEYGSPFVGYSHRQRATYSHLCASVPPNTVNFILQCCRFPILHISRQSIQDGSSVHVAAAFDFLLLLREWFQQTQPSGPDPFPHQLDVNIGTEMQGHTPLRIATMLGNIETVRELLGVEGIDVCRPDKWGTRTALLNAIHRRQYGVVKELLRVKDINVNHCPSDGSALRHASLCSSTDIVQLLLDHPGIDINITGKVGWTALDFASQSGYEDTAALLQSRG
ncbi:ankyrin, partial [Coprinopsis marcescibilis]